MKKIISCLLVCVMLVTLSVTNVFAAPPSAGDSEQFSYLNQNGENVTILTTKSISTATSKVYINGLLTQKSTANSSDETIYTEIYDLRGTMLKNSNNKTIKSCNGFISTTVHMPVSEEKITVTNNNLKLASINSEPVDNTGLSSSPYGDGYYFIGSDGGYYYAPSVYGYLYRKYTATYVGETRRWSWTIGESASAIYSYYSLLGGTPASAIIGILVFTAQQILSYNQSVKLETYNFDYMYKVRVYGTVYFTSDRGITYWKINNTTTGTTKWEEKSYNYGTVSNSEIVRAGIDNYLTA